MNKGKIFATTMGFVMAVAMVLGAFSDNNTASTRSAFFGLVAGTLVILILAGLHRNKAARNRRVLRMMSVLAVVWSVSGVLFFQATRSKMVASAFMAAYAAILALTLFLDGE